MINMEDDSVIKIGIIDDQPNWLTVINDKLKTHYQGLSLFLYRSVKEIDRDLDFILLDIDMPDVDGIEFSKKNLDTKIVFITNYDTRIKEAFGPNVYGYISKSNLENELYNKVDEMITLIKDNYTVSFNVHGQETLVRINDIIYCQFLGGRIVSIVYKNKSLMIKNVTLKKVREKLDNRFIKINRDTIINQNKIIDFQNDNVYLEGVNSRFEVSVRNRTLIKRVFFEKYR
ncbi:response regulator, partial [Thomasclavelia sp.]|uniref:LytR/AlgR family response regulator transcription factor n=1 Tax=Thomasclavelia sp. TaxID=3025757 RepID=UPI0025F41158